MPLGFGPEGCRDLEHGKDIALLAVPVTSADPGYTVKNQSPHANQEEMQHSYNSHL